MKEQNKRKLAVRIDVASKTSSVVAGLQCPASTEASHSATKEVKGQGSNGWHGSGSSARLVVFLQCCL